MEYLYRFWFSKYEYIPVSYIYVIEVERLTFLNSDSWFVVI